MNPPDLCPKCLEAWIASPMEDLPSPKGDGVSDDTKAIQAAIDAGVGLVMSPRHVNSVCQRCKKVITRPIERKEGP